MKSPIGILKESPKKKTLIIATLITAIPFVSITIFFCMNEILLELATGYGVLDFELAWNPSIIDEIFTAWGASGMTVQAYVTVLDYFFIPCYALFGMECILIFSQGLDRKLQETGILMAFTPTISGFFDALENLNLLLMLNQGTSVWWLNPFLASLFATFKISFLVSGLSFLFVTMLYLIIDKYEISILYFLLAVLVIGIILIWFFALWNLLIAVIVSVIYIIIVFIIFLLKMTESE